MILKCDGYKMFRGTVRVNPVIRPDGTRWREPFDVSGDWLYDPDRPGIWYVQPKGDFSQSYDEDILTDFRDENGLPLDVG